jgi:hypothetical protein
MTIGFDMLFANFTIKRKKRNGINTVFFRKKELYFGQQGNGNLDNLLITALHDVEPGGIHKLKRGNIRSALRVVIYLGSEL